MGLELRSRSPLPLSNSHPHPRRRFLRLGIDLMDFLEKISSISESLAFLNQFYFLISEVVEGIDKLVDLGF